jgi:hypothetical protein
MKMLSLLSLVALVGCASPRYAVLPATPNTVASGQRAVAIVRVAIPWYAPRFVVRGKFLDALPEYEANASIEAKYFSISDEGEYGGLYLFTTREAVERHFDAAWHAGVRARRGVDADVVMMDAPFVVEGRARPIGEPRGSRSIKYPASASFVRWELAASADVAGAAKLLATSPLPDEGRTLVRRFIVTAPHAVGEISLWVTREAAESATTLELRERVARAIAAQSYTLTLFEAPLLIDATLRDAREE